MTLLSDTRSVLGEELGSLVVVATVTAVVMWVSAGTPDTTTRAVSTLLAAIAAFGCAAVGLALFSD